MTHCAGSDGYDRNGNRLYRDNVLTDSLSGASEYDELYHADDADPNAAYDKPDRVTEFQRGELDGAKDSISTTSRTQLWALDPLGNWDTLTVTGGGSNQTRTHNKQNQITGGVGGTPTYDDNGNFEGTSNNYTFDAWNRFVLWSASLGVTVTYEYDALHRRIQRLYYDPGVGFAPIEENEGTDYYYTTKWQVIEEQVNGQLLSQHVWSERYVNAPVLRDRDADESGDGSLEERLYYQQDANFNVTALIETDGDVVERLIYDPYGAPSFRDASWGSASTFSAYNNDVLFQGGRRDVNTGLVNFQMRDLSTGLGRWVQVDPAGYVDGMNLYQFVVSNPTNWVDPTGLTSGDEFDWDKDPRWQKYLEEQSRGNDPDGLGVSDQEWADEMEDLERRYQAELERRQAEAARLAAEEAAKAAAEAEAAAKASAARWGRIRGALGLTALAYVAGKMMEHGYESEARANEAYLVHSNLDTLPNPLWVKIQEDRRNNPEEWE